MFEFMNKTIPDQMKESYTGNREYKRYLNGGSEEEFKHDLRKNKNELNNGKTIHYLKEIKINNKLNKRASQLQYRLVEGHGKALYMIGVEDNGNVDGIEMDRLLESINFLYKMAEIVNATIRNVRIYKGKLLDKYICTARIEILNYVANGYPEIEILE
jgi:GTPase